MRRNGAGSRPPGEMPRGHPSPVGAERPHPQRCAGLLRGRSSLAAAPAGAAPSAFCALRVRSCAGAPAPARVRSGAARPAPASRPRSGACALPRFARSPGPALGASPRLSRSALVRRFAPPRALAGPAALGVGLPSLRASSASLRSPLLRVGLPAALRVAPPGPPCAARFAASGPVASAPGACAALWAACFGLRPPGLLCSPRLRGCAVPPWRAAILDRVRTNRETETRAENPQRSAEGIETGQGQESRTKAGKTAQGAPAARLGPTPCASSFAIETVRPCRRLGRTASIPARGIHRRGTGAHREPRPYKPPIQSVLLDITY